MNLIFDLNIRAGTFLAFIVCTSPLVGLQAGPFSQNAELQGIVFNVKSPNTEAGNTVTLTPEGLAGDNAPITTEVRGTVTGIEAADLNADGSPEIYIFIAAPNRGELLAFSTNKKKSLSYISVPDLKEESTESPVYRGGDEFAVLENVLGRRFPLFPDNPNETKPTGKLRQIQYKLVPGESGWLLKPDQVLDF